MVQWWQDPAIEARLAVIFTDSIFVLLGIFGWEYFRTFDVEYAIIRGRLPLRWHLLPYVLGRLCLLMSLILLAIETSPMTQNFPCQIMVTWTTISTDIAIGSSSTNLMVRTWVIWKNFCLVHALLLLIALGHWTILAIDAANIQAVNSNGSCSIRVMHPGMAAGVFMYTVCYDLLVLALSVAKLSKQPSNSPLKERLRAQGVAYFAVAATANSLPAVFAFLGSGALTGITANPAITASTIVSCRAVRSLLGLRTPHASHALNGNEENGVLSTQLAEQLPVMSSRGIY